MHSSAVRLLIAPVLFAAVFASSPARAAAPVDSAGEAPAAAKSSGDAAAPSYQRHVAALFSKLGCNGGTCHGAVKGQNGFRLSMFAADPAGDHERLVREASGRRLDLFAPEQSLLLLKATGRTPHGGGVRLRRDGPEYAVILDWLRRGAPADDLERSRITRLQVTPDEHRLRPGESYRLKVEATFASGDQEDVTAYCSFESLDRSVAVVDSAGTVTCVAAGDAGLVVRYRAQPAAARVLAPRPGPAPAHPPASDNFVDQQVLAKLQALNLPVAPPTDDATFLRRVHLDVTGELPTPDEIRAFLADRSPDKRRGKIDELLARPGHADLWTLKFCDLLKAADFGVYADALSKEHDAPRMQAWIRARLAENTPYDQFVERILLATSREDRPFDEYAAEVEAMFEGYAPGRADLELYARRRTLDLFWQRRGSDGVSGTMQVAHAFLGLRIECAQCHRHPHDNWQQDDLLDFANFFMRVRKVGFQGDNEKKFPDAAAHFQRLNEQAKVLETDVKKRKEGDGKRLDEEAKKAKATADKLAPEIAKLEKNAGAMGAAAKDAAAEIEAKKRELEAARAVVAQAEAFRKQTAEDEKRAKRLQEVARRLMQAESRLLPPGVHAKVVSTLGTRESKTFRLLGETSATTVDDRRDPRELVVAWMKRPDNPYFARAIANRVWAHYFGRGIVDPPDNLSAFNPATHPELLRQLSDGLIAARFDLRWLHRTILNSRTYQQSSAPGPGAEADRVHYAAFPLRRLPAELLLDALNAATGTIENMEMKYHHWPEPIKTVQVPFLPQNRFVSFVLETYGRPQRNAAVQCDCERDPGGSIFQVLTLANHPRVWEKIRDPAGRVARLLKEPIDDDARVDELFLATVSRPPSDEERRACAEFVAAGESREKAWHDLLWSLLNTREFLVQH